MNSSLKRLTRQLLDEAEDQFVTRVKKVTIYGLGRGYSTDHNATVTWRLVPTRTQYGIDLDIKVDDLKVSWSVITNLENEHEADGIAMAIQLGQDDWKLSDLTTDLGPNLPITIVPKWIYLNVPRKEIKLTF